MATTADLGKLVKAKFPGQYDDLGDAALGALVQRKHPGQYDDFTPVPPVQGMGDVQAAQAEPLSSSDRTQNMPVALMTGDPATDEQIAQNLRRAGHTESVRNSPGIQAAGDVAAATVLDTVLPGSSLLPKSRLARVGLTGLRAGTANAGVEAARSQGDPVATARAGAIGAVGGAAAHGLVEGGGYLLKKMGQGAKYLADRLHIKSLGATDADVQGLQQTFGRPENAADTMRGLKTAEGEKALPTFSTARTRVTNVENIMQRTGAEKAELLDRAHQAGAAIDTEAFAAKMRDIAKRTVGSDPNYVMAGPEQSKVIEDAVQRFERTYPRPQVVGVAREGDAALAGGTVTPDLEGFGAKPRLIGAEEQQAGRNLSPRKREILRFPEPDPAASGGTKVGPSRTSTTRPAPDTGWRPVFSDGRPMTINDMDAFKQFLQNDVYSQPIEARSTPMNRFKMAVASESRQAVEDAVHRSLGKESAAHLADLNDQYGKMAELDPLLQRSDRRAFVGTHLPETTYRARHLIPGARYLPQVLAGGGDAASTFLQGLGGGMEAAGPGTGILLARMLAAKEEIK
jgi:hypothetical protein